ncbi:MAG: hypothetical protein Q4B23_05975 [Helcococcus sp.]|nr:hypothetical protein [Helcococcus sp.]
MTNGDSRNVCVVNCNGNCNLNCNANCSGKSQCPNRYNSCPSREKFCDTARTGFSLGDININF